MLLGVAGNTRDVILAYTQVKMIEVPRLSRSAAKWNKAGERRLLRLTDYINQTRNSGNFAMLRIRLKIANSVSFQSKKVWWHDNSRSQSPQWGRWISKQLQIRSRGTRWSHFNGYNHSRVKPKLLRRRKGVWESFSGCQKSRKSLTLTIHWNLANYLKSYLGIIAHLRFTVLKQMVLLKEWCAE